MPGSPYIIQGLGLAKKKKKEKESVDDEAKSMWSEWTKKNSDGVLSVYSLGQSLSSEDRGSHHS